MDFLKCQSQAPSLLSADLQAFICIYADVPDDINEQALYYECQWYLYNKSSPTSNIQWDVQGKCFELLLTCKWYCVIGNAKC